MIKTLSIILTITIFLLFTQSAFASDKITPYPPEMKQTPAIEEVKEEKKGINWLWVLLGVAVAGGIAAAAGGGGGSSSPSSSGGSSGNTTITVPY